MGDISIAHASRGDPPSLLRKAVRMEATINREMAGSSSRIYTPPSPVLSSVALDPVILPPCFDSASFRRDCSLSWITLASGMDLGFMIWGKTEKWYCKFEISWDFQRFHFETDAIVLYLIANRNDFSFLSLFFPQGFHLISKRWNSVALYDSWSGIIEARDESIWTERSNLFYASHLKEKKLFF